MNKNIYVLPVGATFREIKYPEPIVENKQALEKMIKAKHSSIKLGKQLRGGTISQVYQATLDGASVVVKHTENTVPEHPHEFFIPSDGGNTDARILKMLNKIHEIKTPTLIAHFPRFTTHVMEDVSESGFNLLSEKILKKQLPKKSAAQIGLSLALLAKHTREWEEFKTNESAQMSFYERASELLVAYPNNLDLYYSLEAEFTQFDEDQEKQAGKRRFFVWPDGHPKNMLVNNKGEVAFIDFGRSHWGDQRYMLPNFLAHIVLYTFTGHLRPTEAVEYIKNCLQGYQEVEEYTDEKIMIQYLAMELMHRSYGKYIEGVDSTKVKLLAWTFGMHLFDNNVSTVKKFLSDFKKRK